MITKETISKPLIPIVIIGVPRSGTTLLRVLLDSHSKIAAAPETPWILGGYGEYSLRAIAEYLNENYLGPVKNLAGEDEGVVFEGMRAMLDRIFVAYLRKKGKKVLVLKTPDDIRYIEFLLKLYPHSKYLHIYRDGRDVACSTLSRKGPLLGATLIDYGEINYENAMRRWYDWERKVRSVFNGNGAFSYLRISYEELVIHPEETMKRVCEGMGVPYEKEMIDYAKSAHEYPEWEAGSTDVKMKTTIEAGSIGRWKREIGKEELIRLEMRYGSLLEELGYSLGTTAQERAAAAREESVLGGLQRNLIYKEELLNQETNRTHLLEERIKELEGQLRGKSELLAEADIQLQAKNGDVIAKDDELKQLREEGSAERTRFEEKLRLKEGQLRDSEARLSTKMAELAAREKELSVLRDERNAEKAKFEKETRQKDEDISQLINSMSWKITAPLRAVYDMFLRQKK